MDFSTFKSLCNEYTVIPVAGRMLADTLTPVSAYMRLRTNARASFLLESVEGGERVARYSFLGKDPVFTITTRDLKTVFQNHTDTVPVNENFFVYLQALLARYRSPALPDLPRFTGGLVGCIGYDHVRHIEKIPERVANDIGIIDTILGCFGTMLAFDHRKHEIIIIANVFVDQSKDLRLQYDSALAEIESIKQILSSDSISIGSFTIFADSVASNCTQSEFERSVDNAKRHIQAGDIFQIVLSQRFHQPYEGDAFNAYRALRIVNPSPYMYFMDFGNSKIIGSSPEILVRKEGDAAETYPIAGTRPRGATEDEDEQLEHELLADEKERAEHIMLVDLGRNDIGRVSEPGSVAVEDLMSIVRYSHVMHIASRVTGRVKKGMTGVDVFKAAFPAGTVSGAPKVRAMELIDTYEKTRRGIYAGGVGYFDFAGNMDTCIAIRTIYAKNGTLYFQTGAGIVADSDPEKEYQETINKSLAMRKAIETANTLFGGISGRAPVNRGGHT
jgi:anthranilate synthase component I